MRVAECWCSRRSIPKKRNGPQLAAFWHNVCLCRSHDFFGTSNNRFRLGGGYRMGVGGCPRPCARRRCDSCRTGWGNGGIGRARGGVGLESRGYGGGRCGGHGALFPSNKHGPARGGGRAGLVGRVAADRVGIDVWTQFWLYPGRGGAQRRVAFDWARGPAARWWHCCRGWVCARPGQRRLECTGFLPGRRCGAFLADLGRGRHCEDPRHGPRCDVPASNGAVGFRRAPCADCGPRWWWLGPVRSLLRVTATRRRLPRRGKGPV